MRAAWRPVKWLLLLAYACTCWAWVDPHAPAQQQIELGNQALNNGNYQEAVEYFQRAIALSPSWSDPYAGLGMVYALQYTSDARAQGDVQLGMAAARQFKKALQLNPGDLKTTESMAALQEKMGNFEEAKEYYLDAVDLDDSQPYRMMAVARVDWNLADRAQRSQAQRAGLKVGDPIFDKPACPALRQANQKNLEQGMTMVSEALTLRSDLADAMSMMAALYDLRSETHCSDPAAWQSDRAKAADWRKLAATAEKNRSHPAPSPPKP